MQGREEKFVHFKNRVNIQLSKNRQGQVGSAFFVMVETNFLF